VLWVNQSFVFLNLEAITDLWKIIQKNFQFDWECIF